MDKEIKEKLLKGGSSLYDKEWIEKAADEGFDDFIRIFNDSLPADSKYKLSRESNFRFALLYYGAFEHALNTMISQVFDDTMTEVELYMNELHRVTAQIKVISKRHEKGKKVHR